MIWRKRRKTLLILAGVLYVVFGVLAFFDIPGGHDQHHHTFAHNLTHILLGLVLVGLACLFPSAWRQRLCFIFAACYFLIGMAGMIAGQYAMLVIVPGLIEFHVADYGVHLATGLFFFVLGFFKRSDARQRWVPEPG